jgi:hypothetical protein
MVPAQDIMPDVLIENGKALVETINKKKKSSIFIIGGSYGQPRT